MFVKVLVVYLWLWLYFVSCVAFVLEASILVYMLVFLPMSVSQFPFAVVVVIAREERAPRLASRLILLLPWISISTNINSSISVSISINIRGDMLCYAESAKPMFINTPCVYKQIRV